MTTIETTQHTPGPWTVSEQAPYSVWRGDAQIAACRVIDKDGNVEGYMLQGWDSGQARANARLIAAAPALLAALEAAELYLSELTERAGDDSEWARGGNGYVITMGARAAIHAAKGA